MMLALIAVGLVVIGLASPGVSAPSSKPTPHTHRLLWGAWIGHQLTSTEPPWDMTAVTKLERIVGRRLSVVHFASPFADCGSSPCSFYPFPTSAMENVRGHGAIPFFSWSSQSTPSSTTEKRFQLSDVISGAYDSYIRRFAVAARHWGHPFFLRFDWEMNGYWFPWSEGVNGNRAGEYVTAWRHVHDIFESMGATNATWVWCPNAIVNHPTVRLAELYPGNAYVDWTCMDVYNYGTNPSHPSGWESFAQLGSPAYREITGTLAPTKPMIVGEAASSEHGGSKARWIRAMLADLPREYPKVHGVLWFEHYDDGMDWPIETSQAAVTAFRRGIRRLAYVSNVFGRLNSTPIPQPRGR